MWRPLTVGEAKKWAVPPITITSNDGSAVAHGDVGFAIVSEARIMPRRRRTSEDELMMFGRRLRERRLAAGLTQAELAGERFSHAYVSVLEAGRREPSRAAVEYFAQRLGVSVEELWAERGSSWALKMAQDLRAQGLTSESRDLLERTLANLERAGELHPRVLVVLHRQLAQLDLAVDRGAAMKHLEKAIALAANDDYLAVERALALVMLGDLVADRRNTDQTTRHYRTAIDDLLDAVGRRGDLDLETPGEA
jgi:transcriptional regulator with XRE-family HTH domain